MQDEVEFPHFDLVNLAKDHRYINSNKSGKMNNTTIMKEWRILKNNLPDSIYVQVYETRTDLLRAAIIGPAGTPYHDGLFFFDILLPPNYPNEPPKVYYHSRGYRLNPNLYANGYVCLSLINTWRGTQAERWSGGSTILQLLVSIQGLVLNSRPYFNEPGLKRGEKSKNWKWVNASNRYNEEAFILSCWTMLHIIRQPPAGFKAFVVEHFRQRATSLLAALHHYGQGGRFEMNSKASSSKVCVHPKFKSDLDKTYQLLYKAFYHLVPNLYEEVTKAKIELMKRRDIDRVQSSIVKHENEKKVKQHEKKAKKHKEGILSKITSFIKKIWK